MSRFKRFIKWLVFGYSSASQTLETLNNFRNSEKKNEFTTSRTNPIGSFFYNHLFGIANRTASSVFESEAGQGSDVRDDAGDFAWCWTDYLDAGFDSDEIGGELNTYANFSSVFDDDDHGYRACGVNPANGLPMLDDCIDIHGNPYGTDFSDSGSFVSDDHSFDSFWRGSK